MNAIVYRSVPTPMTNGDLSPTKLNAVPTLPNLAPPDNSLLNTVAPGTTTNTTSTPEVKTESEPNDKHLTCTNASDTSVNTTQDNENNQGQSELAASDSNCSENKEVVSEVDEHSPDTTVNDGVENCVENGSNAKVVSEEGAEISANAETTTGQ